VGWVMVNMMLRMRILAAEMLSSSCSGLLNRVHKALKVHSRLLYFSQFAWVPCDARLCTGVVLCSMSLTRRA
jgi:hypothetical protein